jgi:hypothetical protein
MVRITARLVVLVVLGSVGCRHAATPAVRRGGQIAAIGGVVGLMGSAVAARYTPAGNEMIIGFSVISGAGIVTYALAELSDPELEPAQETETQKLRRWAKILTERAAGAARENRCPRVRRLERRVQLYDPEVHDFVFMRDPEIVRCLDGSIAPSQ